MRPYQWDFIVKGIVDDSCSRQKIKGRNKKILWKCGWATQAATHDLLSRQFPRASHPWFLSVNLSFAECYWNCSRDGRAAGGRRGGSHRCRESAKKQEIFSVTKLIENSTHEGKSNFHLIDPGASADFESKSHEQTIYLFIDFRSVPCLSCHHVQVS